MAGSACVPFAGSSGRSRNDQKMFCKIEGVLGISMCCKSCPPEEQLAPNSRTNCLLFPSLSSPKQTHQIHPTSLPSFDLWKWCCALLGGLSVQEPTLGALLSPKSLVQLCLMPLGAFAFHLSRVGLSAVLALNGSAGGFAWWWRKKSWCLAKDMK